MSYERQLTRLTIDYTEPARQPFVIIPAGHEVCIQSAKIIVDTQETGDGVFVDLDFLSCAIDGSDIRPIQFNANQPAGVHNGTIDSSFPQQFPVKVVNRSNLPQIVRLATDGEITDGAYYIEVVLSGLRY